MAAPILHTNLLSFDFPKLCPFSGFSNKIVGIFLKADQCHLFWYDDNHKVSAKSLYEDVVYSFLF